MTGYECTGTTPSVCSPICGDSRVISPETCDDGNKNDNIGCTNTCSGALSGYTCTPGDLNTASVCVETCGDGVKTALQPCDDGDLDAGDGCSPTCTVEPKYSCTGSPSVCKPICHDGYVISPETCDDGLDDDLGCMSDCSGAIAGFNCVGGD